MHQFLNQLLAKKKKKRKSFATGCRSAFQQLNAELGLAQSARGRERVPHFLLTGTTGSTGSTEVFTGRSLDGPRSSLTANRWYFASGAWPSVILQRDPKEAACPDKKGTELEPEILAKIS